MKKTIYVYSDLGVGEDSLPNTISSLKKTTDNCYSIEEIKACDVVSGTWIKDAALFVMPGGADIPYAQKLNGIGNTQIKTFVEDGGAYLGICAGSYYASKTIEFDQEGSLEVIDSRELCFFEGKAIGPIFAPFDYSSNSGHRAAKIKLEDFNSLHLSYNGGPYFLNAGQYKDVNVLGWFEHNATLLPALLHIKHDQGNVILSSAHIEFDASLADKNDPYLTSILPILEASNTQRLSLFKHLLNRLGVTPKHD